MGVYWVYVARALPGPAEGSLPYGRSRLSKHDTDTRVRRAGGVPQAMGEQDGQPMNTRRWVIGVTGLLLVLLSLWQIQAAASGLKTVRVSPQGVPMVFLGPGLLH
jgi:hypothetical protein